MRMRDAIQFYLVAILAFIVAPFGLRGNHKAKKRAARNQKIYKEMYRGKYGF